jgi:hypothetical protein
LSKGVRAQLDVMWARESHTVATNWVRAKADYDMTNRWRPGRVEDGIKWTAKERRRKQFHGMEEGGLPCRREFGLSWT